MCLGFENKSCYIVYELFKLWLYLREVLVPKIFKYGLNNFIGWVAV